MNSTPPSPISSAGRHGAACCRRRSASESFYEQVGLDQPHAYEVAIEHMASAAMIDDAQEGFSAFLEKRHPNFVQRPAGPTRRLTLDGRALVIAACTTASVGCSRPPGRDGCGSCAASRPVGRRADWPSRPGRGRGPAGGPPPVRLVFVPVGRRRRVARTRWSNAAGALRRANCSTGVTSSLAERRRSGCRNAWNVASEIS